LARKTIRAAAQTQGARGMKLRDTIAGHFERMERDKRYLSMLAMQHPQVYCALVAKVIPQQVAVDVTHHVIDLGQLMLDAHATLKELRTLPPAIDNAPLASPALSPPELAASRTAVQPAALNSPSEAGLLSDETV
jgi:hypothetical protein